MSQWWLVYRHTYVTRPQWVKEWFHFYSHVLLKWRTNLLVNRSKTFKGHDFVDIFNCNFLTQIIVLWSKFHWSLFLRVQLPISDHCCRQWFGAALRWRHNDHAGVSNHQPHGCLLNRLFRRKSKKTSKLRVTGLCAGNSPGTGEFPAEMASYAENVSIWWRHHGTGYKVISEKIMIHFFFTHIRVTRPQLEPLECLHSEIPPAAPWLPILLINIVSQVKTRRSHSYKF